MTEYEKRRTRGETEKTAEKGLGVEGTLQIISSFRSSKRCGEEQGSKIALKRGAGKSFVRSKRGRGVHTVDMCAD